VLKSTNTEAPEITYNDVLLTYKVENTLQYFWTEDGNYQMNIGTVDLVNAQTWTMADFPLNTEPNGDGIDLADAPNSGNFPTATHCRLYKYKDGSDDEFFYEFYKFSDTEIVLLGYVDTIPAQEWSEKGVYNEQIAVLPLGIGTNFTSTDTVLINDTTYQINGTVKTEGFGTLKSTYGDAEVLKIRTDYNVKIYDENDEFVEENNRIYYTFYSKNGTRLLMKLHEDSPVTNTVNIEYVEFERVVFNTTAINEIDENANSMFYPNPTNNEIRFSEAGDYKIYNISGSLIRDLKNIQVLNISDLQKGSYIIQNNKGVNQKLIVP
jgi:hypothetical protein